ncbi:MAG: hypothetical protein R2786_09900 [Flavobacteriaceae bacterium]
MKKLLNLQGAQLLSKQEQLQINGGDNACQIGCVGKPAGAACHVTADCLRPGTCGTNPLGGLTCVPN